MSGSAIVAHGGGPTAVLNASLAGVIRAACDSSQISALFGARHGAAGLLDGDWLDLSRLSANQIDLIARAPGSALGSSRRKIEPSDFDQMLARFKQHDVRYVFYTGGNGSMGTALELHRCAQSSGYELNVIGIPKTIDNDLSETDHTPGYASCARFFALAARDAGEDNRSLPTPIMLLEVLGRNAGWLVAATSLARRHDDDPPHLIYCPERRLSADRLCADVEAVYRRLGRCFVAVCEGQPDEKGGWYDADLASPAGTRGQLPANLGHSLARMIWTRTGLRARCERPGLVARSCSSLASLVDRAESVRCGEQAVRAAVAGESAKMVSIVRAPDLEYHAEFPLVALERVAGIERLFPGEWILDHDVSPEYRKWAAPLVGPIDPTPRLDSEEAIK